MLDHVVCGLVLAYGVSISETRLQEQELLVKRSSEAKTKRRVSVDSWWHKYKLCVYSDEKKAELDN